MKHSDAITLISKAINPVNVLRWAELGCGSGTFTLALADLLSPGSEIFAYDIKQQSLPASQNEVSIYFDRLDFEKEKLPVTNVGGILMANSMHYTKEKADLILRLDVPKLIVVEYESRSANPWVPYPIPSGELIRLFNIMGYHAERLADIPSRFGGRIYSVVATRKS